MEEALPPATEAPVSSIRPMESGRSARTAGGLPKRGARMSPNGVGTGGEQSPRRSARRGSGSLAALQRGTQSARDTASFDTPTPGGSENA